MIPEETLTKLYVDQKYSVKDIAKQLGCSTHKISYWMDRYDIKRRSISDAIYSKRHPGGDPFHVKEITSLEDARLYGLGIGLYWGEGTKSNKHSVRLGNTDPELIKTFISFLVELYGVRKDDLRFGL